VLHKNSLRLHQHTTSIGGEFDLHITSSFSVVHLSSSFFFAPIFFPNIMMMMIGLSKKKSRRLALDGIKKTITEARDVCLCATNLKLKSRYKAELLAL
jgi:hypothetical protein